MNRLEDLLALSICAQCFLVTDIVLEGFGTEQKLEQSKILGSIIVIDNQLNELEIKKQLLLKQHFFKTRHLFLWPHLAKKHYTGSISKD